MKLLMITQKIDTNDDILGVYHEWAREIAKSFEKLSVICLYRGFISLPKSIRVFSLGKEKKRSRFLYLKNFYAFIWSLRNNYDVVFVHMNPIYIALGFIPWRIMGKKMYMWYAHPADNIFVRLGYLLCDKIVTSVPEAFYIKSKKVIAIGQGIDTALFSPSRNKGIGEKKLLYLGRISPSKRVEVLLEAVFLLKNEGADFSVSIVGDPSDAYGGKAYCHSLQKFVIEHNLSGVARFFSSVPNRETQHIYNQHEIFVNLSPLGYFDKTVLEAMACERLVLASNEAYKSLFPKELQGALLFRQNDPADLAIKIKKAIALSADEKKRIGMMLRQIVERDHSIRTFGERLKNAFT